MTHALCRNRTAIEEENMIDSIVPQLKFCQSCKTEKPLTAFPPKHDRKELLGRCLSCAEIFDARRAEDKTLQAAGLKKCRICDQMKPLSEFSERRGFGRAPGATVTRCKPCVAELSIRHYYASKEHNAERAEKASTALLVKGDVLRECGGCKRQLSLAQFPKAKRSPDGFRRLCRDCGRDGNRKRSSNAFTKEAETRRLRNHNLKRYGISQDVFDVMLEAQDYKCAVCPISLKDAADSWGVHVDHNHETGMVRALLCRDCNVALGAAKDSLQRLLELAAYLERFQTEKTPPPHSPPDVWRAYYAALKTK